MLLINGLNKKHYILNNSKVYVDYGKQDFGSRLLAAEGEGGGGGAVRVREERTGVGKGEGCV